MKIAIMTAALFAASAHGQQVMVKGIPLGADRAQLLARYPKLDCSRLAPQYRANGDEMCGCTQYKCTRVHHELETYAGSPMRGVAFSLVEGRVEGFSATFGWSFYAPMRDTLAAAYGPGSEGTQVLQTQRGAQVPARAWSVEHEGATVMLLERAGSLDQGSVEIATPVLRARRDSERAEKKGKKDL